MKEKQWKKLLTEGKQLVNETGEMGYADIKPGGEDYEWAKSIEDAAKEIQKLTKGKFKFSQMRPFDKYQGPYAYGTLNGSAAKLWSDNTDGDFFYLDCYKNEHTGDPETIAAAINGDEEAIKQSKKLLQRNR